MREAPTHGVAQLESEMGKRLSGGPGIWVIIAKFRQKLQKVGKTTRLFRYDINKSAYNYTVEVTKGLKGLDLMSS